MELADHLWANTTNLCFYSQIPHDKGSSVNGWPLLKNIFTFLTSHIVSQIPLPKPHLGQDTHLDTLRTSPVRKNIQRKSLGTLSIKGIQLHQQTLLWTGTRELHFPSWKTRNELCQQTWGGCSSDESDLFKSNYMNIHNQTAFQENDWFSI